MSTQRKCIPQTLLDVLQETPNITKSIPVISGIELEQMAHYPFKGYVPVLNREALAQTLSGYERHEKEYNKKVLEANKKIKEHNERVDIFWHKSGKMPMYEKQNDSFRSARLHKRSKKLHLHTRSVWEFNVQVAEANLKMGEPVYKMEKVHPLKEAHRTFFKAILRKYELDLFNLKNYQEKTRSGTGENPYRTTVPRVEVNTYHLMKLKHKSGQKILLKKKNAYLLIKKRLEEAGVLQDRAFRGSDRGVLYFIDPKILTIFDDFTGKFITTENQQVKKEGTRKEYDKDTPTRAISKQEIKKGVDKSNPFDKDKGQKPLNIAHPTDDSTRAPSGKMKNAAEENQAEISNRAEKIVKNGVSAGIHETTSHPKSAELLQKITDPAHFAKELSKNPDKMDVVPLEKLDREAHLGTLSQDEFRNLLIQELFKDFCKLYLKHPHFDVVFVGAWLRIYQVWLHGRVFRNKNGSLLQKTTMLTHYREMLYCIQNKQWGVLSWIKKGRFVPPSPFVYLNPENPTKGTFVHHFRKVQEKSPKAFGAIRKAADTSKKAGIKSRVYDRHLNRLNKKFSQLFNGKINDTTLLMYVRDNMPMDIRQNFQKHFDNYRNNRSNSSKL